MNTGQRFRLLPRRKGGNSPVRGTVSHVIVVRSPAPCFREALFVLRDEYLSDENANREELLRQARQAAASFTGPASPPPPRSFLWLLPLLGLLILGGLRLFQLI